MQAKLKAAEGTPRLEAQLEILIKKFLGQPSPKKGPQGDHEKKAIAL